MSAVSISPAMPLATRAAAPHPPEGMVHLTPLLSASLLSAVGSLALHLAPFFTVVLIADSRTSVAGAGWVRSAAQLGEFLIALALPLIGLSEIGRKATLMTTVALIGGLALAVSRDLSVFLFGWFVIGACSGILKYLGVIAASKMPRLSLAFSLRLSIILMLAGSVSAFFASRVSRDSYEMLLLELSIVLAAIVAIGLLLHRGSQSESATKCEGVKVAPANTPAQASFVTIVSGLGVVCLFFVGISGALVYVLHQAVGHGMTLEEAAWALAGTKFVVGAWLLISAYFATKKERQERFVLQAGVLVTATVAIYLSRGNFELLLSLLFWEIAVNNLSARLQAAVVGVAPQLSGRWLNLAILLGGAIGPAINGLTISIGHGYIYVVLGAATAFAPAIWNRFYRP